MGLFSFVSTSYNTSARTERFKLSGEATGLTNRDQTDAASSKDGGLPCEFHDLRQFLINFQDYLSPRLDTYEQAIYLYLFRHTLLTGKEEAVIGFKSARARMACGIGQEGRPMSENTAYVKLQSLAAKGCIKIVASEHAGRRIRVKLPKDIPGIIPEATTETPVSLDAMDFFDVPENRQFILQREENRCFYCLRSLTPETHVIEHVVSRPNGDSSYRNVVAACRECNNRKGSALARDFLRSLYRDGFLSDKELEGRLSHLERLECGDLKPVIPPR